MRHRFPRCQIALALLAIAFGGCARAGFKGQSADDGPRHPDTVALSDTVANNTVADAAADAPSVPPTTRVSGGTTDPAWTDVELGSTALQGSTIHLEEEDGFGTKNAVLPTAVAWGAAASHQDHIYLFGGGTKVGTYASTTQISAYSPASDTVTPVGSLPYPLLGLQAVPAKDGKIYVMMGIDPTISAIYESRALRYDPVLHSVSVAFEGLYAAYHHGSALGADDVIYSFAGYGSGPLQTTIEGFDPANATIVQVGTDLAAYGARDKLSAHVVPNGDIYLFGGALTHDDAAHLGGQISNQIIKFTPSTSSVTLLTATLPEPLINMAGGVLPDGRIYLAGGDTPSGQTTVPTKAIYCFDPTTGALTTLIDKLPEALGGAAAAVGANGKLYLLGGRTQGGLSAKILELHPYAADGEVIGPVIDTGAAATSWGELDWQATVPTGTTVELHVRAADAAFTSADNTPSWQSVNTPPVTTGLPQGRYLQWKATLRTSNTALTSTLAWVSLSYGE